MKEWLRESLLVHQPVKIASEEERLQDIVFNSSCRRYCKFYTQDLRIRIWAAAALTDILPHILFWKKYVLLIPDFLGHSERASIEYIFHWASGVGLRKNRGRTHLISNVESSKEAWDILVKYYERRRKGQVIRYF
jgi:hypothetical protein